MPTALPCHRYLAPRYWPTWLGLGLLRAAIYLPYSVQMGLGRRLGHMLLRVSAKRRHVAAVNLALCFPDLSGHARKCLLQDHFASLGMALFETALSWWASDKKLTDLGRIEGLEHLQSALAQGKGVILLSAHFTTLEIGGRLLARHAPFHIMYREHKNALFNAVMKQARERNFERAIARWDVRGMLDSLKRQHAVWYAPDQNYGAEHSVFVPFFGVPSATITATARLTELSGAPVVPFFPQRLPDYRGYRLQILPALRDYPQGDLAQDAAHINHILETAIREQPEQYLWVHRRFKTRPPGEAGLYSTSTA